MVKQTKQNTADEQSKFINKTKIIDYTSQNPSKSINKTHKINFNDDLIVSLADSYENKRARQVIEWERLQRRNFMQQAV